MTRLTRKILDTAGFGAEASRIDSGIDIVGDIAVLRETDLDRPAKVKIAAAILENVHSVRCVFEQRGGIEGEFRLRNLAHIGGEDRTVTTHRENGCAFRVDIAQCYFSPRLSTERLRLADAVGQEESVLNMFAGVGPFSIPIAKKKKARVTSCELNAAACKFHLENDRLNKVDGLIEVVNADAMELPRILGKRFDRILMPHPSKANLFLSVALSLAAPRARIHYYRHLPGRDEGEAEASLRAELTTLLPPKAVYSVRKVREIGPRWLEMAADIVLKA
jgi:tRNA (guanine37-N1)-methyltransferase